MIRTALSALFLATLATAAADEPALRQAALHGLLVSEGATGKLAGTSPRMNATVVKTDGGFELGFNQDVGPQMGKATEEVRKFLAVRHPDKLPAGCRIELAFSEPYSPKDGPSAAVACSLLAESILTGRALDDQFAVTGDMTAEGKVRPIGGVPAKLRGATKSRCPLVAVPAANEQAVTDTAIIDGLKPLYQIQICTIATFDDALKLASKTREPAVQQALDDFAAVQQALARNEAFVFNPKLQEKLRAVLQTLPNHASAKFLLLHGLHQAPNRLSLAGSILAIDQADQALAGMLHNQSWLESGGNDDVLYKFIGEMERLRTKLDKRTVGYGDAYRELALYIKSIRARRLLTEEMRNDLRAAVQRVESKRDALMAEPEIREELMLE
jgi:hypothetical protein